MANFLKKLHIIILSGVAAVVVCGCEKKPDSNTPGKQTIPDNAPEELLSDPVLPIDTVAPADTVAKPEPEIERVTTKETSELIEFMDQSAHAEEYASGILHRMAYDSPEYTRKLINSTYSHFIIVDKQAMELALFDRYGREELRYGIACGKGFGTKVKKGDCRTSEGFFSAEGIYDSTDWLYTDDNGRTSKKKGQFGPRFVRLRIPNTSSIGIHGTCAPGSIGRRTSHGCIRVKNANILELVEHVTIGMPIIVSPSNRDMEINRQEGRYIDQVTINPKSKRKSRAEKEALKKKLETEETTAPKTETEPSDSIVATPDIPVSSADTVSAAAPVLPE